MKIYDNGTTRDMTADEEKRHRELCEQASEQNAALDAKTAARASARAKLAVLGLTDDEIAALVGG